MNTVIMSYTIEVAFWNRMDALDLSHKDEEGALVDHWEDRAGRCITPAMGCSDGSKVLRMLMTPEDAAKMPPEANPAFSLLWDSSDLVDDGEGNMVVKAEPVFEVDTYDEDGQVNGTSQAVAPKIAGY